jgi:recombination protein RecA
MSTSGLKLEDLRSMAQATRAALAYRPSAGWSLQPLAGRLIELSGVGASASTTLAFALVLDTQRQGEPAVWVTTTASHFYPPDAAEGGVDLDALVVVRVPDPRAVARVADRLVRSGAFGLLVLDLGAQADVPTPLQARLAGLAQTHDTGIVCLTETGDEAPSLGSLVSLRVHARRRKLSQDRFSCELTVLKDKRRGPTWAHAEVCRGPAGLC